MIINGKWLYLALCVLLAATFCQCSWAEMSYVEYQANLARLLMLVEQSDKSFQEVEQQLKSSLTSLESQKCIINEQANLINSLQREIDFWKAKTMSLEEQSTLALEQLQRAEVALKKQEESLLSYKEMVERKIRSLVVQRNVAVLIGLVKVFGWL